MKEIIEFECLFEIFLARFKNGVDEDGGHENDLQNDQDPGMEKLVIYQIGIGHNGKEQPAEDLDPDYFSGEYAHIMG
jgi:hypothetical protein